MSHFRYKISIRKISLKILIFGIMPLSLCAMESNDTLDPIEWRKTQLKILLSQAFQTTCNERNGEIKKLKVAFVAEYEKKYHDQQEFLADLCEETHGKIRATADPELAQKDPNKFLCLDPLECTAEEIEERWKLIHQADCKYMSLIVTIKNQSFPPAVPIQPCNKK